MKKEGDLLQKNSIANLDRLVVRPDTIGSIMTPALFPASEWLTRRRAWEKSVTRSIAILRMISVSMVLIVLGLCFLPLSLMGLTGILFAIPAIWAGSLVFFVGMFFRKPNGKELAKRGDKVLGLQDDLLALSEFPTGKSTDEWRAATWKKAQISLEEEKRSWPLVFPKWYSFHVLFAILLTLGAAWMGGIQMQAALKERAAMVAAREDRIEAAEEIIRDWEEFVKTSDDPELKKLFSEAAHLREAVQNNDPMAAMLAMNRIEAKMSSLQDALAAESLAPQAARMAEALEAFEGMSSMSAALRNLNFDAAAKEAEKLGAKLDENPAGSTALRRGASVAEMLANEAATAQKRGNGELSETLSKLSSAASQNCKNGSVPNSQLSQCLSPLKNQFCKESACKSCGRMVSMGKCQLDALRQKFRGESCEKPPSLCKSGSCNKPGGLKAGTGTDGQPLGDPTKLADAGETDKLTGTMGEGESETVTTTANSGTPGTTGAGTKTSMAEYIELSERAVADESLPLAHRRAIRTYFERIRPVAESQHP